MPETLVAGAFVGTHEALGPWPGVSEANVRRIRPGMTLAEVEALLGGPGIWMGDGMGRAHPRHPYLWADRGAWAVVTLHGGAFEDGWRELRVVGDGVAFYRDENPGPLDRLREALGR